MSDFLFKIGQLSELAGQRLMLTSELKIRQIPQHLRVGQCIELRADGRPPIPTVITSIEFDAPFNPHKPLSFMVERHLTEQDVPIGTEVWLPPSNR
jgi:hypothetical protein